MKFRTKLRSLAKRLSASPRLEIFYLSVPFDHHASRLTQLGFSSIPTDGELILPSREFGAACRRNVDGDTVVHRERPMEVVYRQVEWHWHEYRGPYERVEKSDIRDVPCRRYPRSIVAPYAIELRVVMINGSPFVLGGPLSLAQDKVATNTLHMFIELFGVCDVLDRDLSSVLVKPTRQLNWQLLPPGKNPWHAAIPALKEVIERAGKGNQPVLQRRFDAVCNHSPDFVAVGRHGFDGYVAFGFESAGICVMECSAVNNATYVLPLTSWEALSQWSKAEILDEKVAIARLIHRRSWFGALDALVALRKKAA